MSWNQKDYLKAGLVVFVLVAAVFTYSVFTSKSVTTNPGQQPIQTNGGLSTFCTGTSGATSFSPIAQYLTNSGTPATYTQVNTSFYVFLAGAQTPAISSSTPASGTTQISGVACGSPVTVIIGDGGTTYYYSTVQVPGASNLNANPVVYGTDRTPLSLSAIVQKSSVPTIAFQNSTAGSWASTVTQAGVLAGTSSNVQMQVTGGQYYYGDNAYEICAQYEIHNFTSVQLNPVGSSVGITTITGQDGSITAVNSSYALNCYQVNHALFNGAVDTFKVQVNTGTSAPTTGAFVKMTVNDHTAYLLNGQLISGYTNPTSTSTDIGAAQVATAVNAISYNP